MRRPSPATAIATTALFVALSGTAYAATGGNFILGRSNLATSTTSLTNSKGAALSLNSKAGTPPLAVGSSVVVPNLDASLLGGLSAGVFVQGGGNIHQGDRIMLAGESGPFAVTSGFDLYGECTDVNARMSFENQGTDAVTAVWWNADGTASQVVTGGSSAPVVGATSAPRIVLVQVTYASRVITFIASQAFSASNGGTCTFGAEVADSL